MSEDILAAIDAAIDDTEAYIEWHGSADSATWAADGSHEPEELDGDYYAYDRPDPDVSDIVRGYMGSVAAWQRTVVEARTRREVLDDTRAREVLLDGIRPGSHNQPRYGLDGAWGAAGWLAVPAPDSALRRVTRQYARRGGRPHLVVTDEAQRLTMEELTGARAVTPQELLLSMEPQPMLTAAQRLAAALHPAATQALAATRHAAEVVGRVAEQLNQTVTADDRRSRPRRSGRDAQTSPYPTPGRRR